MSFLVDLSILGWVPAIVVAFSLWSPRTAVLISIVAGCLFLPERRGYHIPSFVTYDKTSVIFFAALAGTLVTDMERVFRFRFMAADIPMALFCLMPGISTLATGYGVTAAIHYFLAHAVLWGGPYFIGRLYFTDREGLQDLALAILIAGLIYMPLCLYEVRMSPQLNHIVYGYTQHSFIQSLRGDGYRPMVFMQHGLMVGLWMAVTGLFGYAFFVSKAVKRVFNVPIHIAALALLATAVLCKSTGALAVLLVGLVGLEASRRLKSKAVLWILLIFPVTYVSGRILGFWPEETLLNLASMVSPDRAASLNFRMEAENQLIEAVGDKSMFGRGPVGFNIVDMGSYGPQMVVADSLWIIIFARWGGLALISMFAAFLWPVYRQFRSIPARLFLVKQHVCATVLAVALGMFLVDCVFNAMINPIYIMIMGGLTGYALPNSGRQ